MDAMTADARMPTDREIVITRLIDAPRELVFDAWTDPEQVVQWWGPRGFTTTTHKMEVKPGGVWRFVMHGPDGRDYQNKITYLEIVPPERLVYRHGGDEDLEPVSFQTTVTFAAEGGKTRGHHARGVPDGRGPRPRGQGIWRHRRRRAAPRPSRRASCRRRNRHLTRLRHLPRVRCAARSRLEGA